MLLTGYFRAVNPGGTTDHFRLYHPPPLAILFPLRSLVSQHEQFRHFPCVAVLSTLGNHVSVSDALAYYWTFDAGTGVRHGKHTSDKLRRLF